MDQNNQLFLKKLFSSFTSINLTNLFKSTQPYIEELQNFHFYFSNPVFDLLILIVFLLLFKTWGLKKTFSYCLIISSILYLTTRIMSHIDMPIDSGEITYGAIIKILAIFAICIISIYYFFLKES